MVDYQTTRSYDDRQMGKKRTKLSDEMRQAVKDFTAMSRNGICRELGIDKGLFSRFMAGTAGLSVGNLDALADLLDLHIVVNAQAKARRVMGKGKVTK